ncbi:type VI secretion system protein ImpH [Duganella sp. CF402]|uniref:type VI secretion system baseplate subunit TssG n=1 Tax=unclassified Duganella TaxID=2636909 RepID=UPI0008D1527F|nr:MULTISPECIES: type VI secretion system baseplate subunit TssG [unclassified Duganella]RZT10034.1 type VI secretion system protein ImpH [Duganella sp. BK701]SEL31578.1 type VI secretion system protein ImpH [Duganella sp. CF402]
MLATKRRFEPAVIERLFSQPHKFEYFQAVRMLELWLRRHGAPGESAVANFLRFQNSTSLSFPASQLETLQPEPRDMATDARSLGEALKTAQLRYIRITPAFMGFLGSSGTLPAHYTERIAAHTLYQKDEGPRAFLDTFSNRALALFYEAWRKYRLELKYQLHGRDEFLPLLLSLAGMHNPSLRRRLSDGGDGVLDESVAYFATAMGQRPASAVQIARVLSEYFCQPVRAEQFIGAWYDVPAGQQTTLGMANAVLGGGAMTGARVWQRDLRLRLVIGPLDLEGYESFLPGGKAARALENMLTMFTGVSLEYEVQLVLRAEDVQGARLDEDCCGGRLGWDSFLVTEAQRQDRSDVRYEIHTS